MAYSQQDIQSIQNILLTVPGYPDTVSVADAIAILESQGVYSFGSTDMDSIMLSADRIVYALSGNDYVNAGAYNGTVYGGDGDDMIIGSRGHNVLYGDAGNDILDSGSDASQLYGGDGDDILRAAMVLGGGHELTGGAGADTFEFRAIQGTATQSAVITDFQEGVDQIVIDGQTIDFATLGTGMSLDATADGTVLHYGDDDSVLLRDFQTAYVPNGMVDGTNGNDYFRLGFADVGGDAVTAGDDTIFGYDGDDYLNTNSGNDVAYGGDGNDMIIGSRGHNTLYGDAGNDILDSGANASQLYGGDGDDIIRAAMVLGGGHELTGGAGADVFEFRATHGTAQQSAVITDFEKGVDTISIVGQVLDFDNLPAGITLETTAAGMVVHYGDNDTILLRDVQTLSLADGIVDGTSGNDRFVLGTADAGGDMITIGDDIVYGYAGDDYLNVNLGNDIVYGGDGNDTIYGVRGNNELYGDAGNDTLDAGTDASQLFGGDGNDILRAAMVLGGGHELTGGAGADMFVFRATQGTAQQTAHITDFEKGVDQIAIETTVIDLTSLPTGVTLSASGSDAVLHYGDNDTIIFDDYYLTA